MIGPLLAARPGIRVPRCWDPFEVAVATLTEQQARPASQRVVEGDINEQGRQSPGVAAFRLTHTFPGPGVLTRGRTGLLAAGLTNAQAEIVTSFSVAVEHGVIRLDGSTTSGEVISTIAVVPAVIAITAENVALRMGEPDAFLADDSALQQLLRRFSGTPNPPPLDRAWEPQRSYAAAHLWGVSLRSCFSLPARREYLALRTGCGTLDVDVVVVSSQRTGP